MYKTQVTPQNVQATLSKHILADGFDLTFDMEKSQGVHIYDSKNNTHPFRFFYLLCIGTIGL
jgi:L-lysine 6-transaminase